MLRLPYLPRRRDFVPPLIERSYLLLARGSSSSLRIHGKNFLFWFLCLNDCGKVRDPFLDLTELCSSDSVSFCACCASEVPSPCFNVSLSLMGDSCFGVDVLLGGLRDAEFMFDIAFARLDTGDVVLIVLCVVRGISSVECGCTGTKLHAVAVQFSEPQPCCSLSLIAHGVALLVVGTLCRTTASSISTESRGAIAGAEVKARLVLLSLVIDK